MNKKPVFQIFVFFLLFQITDLIGQCHPNLILTKEGVEMIKTGPTVQSYEDVISKSKKWLDTVIKNGIQVPIPKDMAGGYTHEQHKVNYKAMYTAGIIYQISEETKYLKFIKDMLFKYASMYKNLPIHPTDRSYATGKIFWQCLNDANWLVYTSQAYDCIYTALSDNEREYLEKELFLPFANFLSIENPKFFNRIHNHSTWANAAVGMIGITMGNDTLIQKSLYGLEMKQNLSEELDNDGGYIYEEGGSKAGFYAQLDYGFSPDGYYNEGPYYQRYAMTPFLLFAQSLDNYDSSLGIFSYKDSILIKAVYALVNQIDPAGKFFPINDAQKGMSIKSSSVIQAIDITYGLTKDPELLYLAKLQKTVSFDHYGYMVAKGIKDGLTKKFQFISMELRDGKKGDEGALGIIRSYKDNGKVTVAFKYTSQGLGHGHYDKLSYSLYDGNTEVLQDYGAARFVNVDQKDGGRYLKENNTWAKQSIAHNTIVIDQKSHFGGVYKVANEHHSNALNFDVSSKEYQLISAKEANAYPDIDLTRTLVLWEPKSFEYPILLDVLKAEADTLHTYDVPYHYKEHLLSTSFDYEVLNRPEVFGDKHGYQHVYKEAEAILTDSIYQIDWMQDDKFYTITGINMVGDQIFFNRIGANDPSFNLRHDAFFMMRRKASKSQVFVSLIECHGVYNRNSEVPKNLYGKIENLVLMHQEKDYVALEIENKRNEKWLSLIYIGPKNENIRHVLRIKGKEYTWEGSALFIKSK